MKALRQKKANPAASTPYFSIKFSILSAFMALLAISSLTIIYYTYKKNADMIISFAKDEMHKVSNIFILKTTDFLNKAEYATRLGSSLIDNLNEVTLENEDFIHFMIAIAKINSQIDNYYIGTVEGNFLMITHLKHHHKMQFEHPPPKKALYLIRYLDRTKNPPEMTWIYLDEKGNKITSFKTPDPTFDPRTRPWYIKAKNTVSQKSTLTATEKETGFFKLSWSPVYFFYFLKEVGITVSEPVFNGKEKFIGVFATDLSLHSISSFLKSHPLAKGANVAILGPKGEIVVVPNLEEEEKSLKHGKQLTIYNAKHKIYQTAIQAYSQRKQDYFTFNYDNKKYLASFLPFPKQFQEDWKILLTVPLEDYLGAVISTNLHSLYISLGIFAFTAILIYVLSKRISKPIVELTDEIDAIGRFDLDREIIIQSKIKEIHIIQSITKVMQEAVKQFSFYVPKELVQRLILTRKALELGGSLKKMTVFFSDVQNFTGISEKIPAENLLLYLSDFLDEVSKIILEQQGTIDKYIGDNVMAFWGAPEDDPDQAIHGCRAALFIIKKLKALNAKWVSEGRPAFNVRIGIHTDEVVVGNIGTFERRNYTAIGDGVNLAARLDPLNKLYGTNIIISENLYSEVKQNMVTRPLGVILIKGKQKSVKVYELIGDLSVEELKPSEEKIAYYKRFEEAFDLYSSRKVSEAILIFQELAKEDPTDKVCLIYCKRCQNLIDNPLSKESDWEIKVDVKHLLEDVNPDLES